MDTVTMGSNHICPSVGQDDDQSLWEFLPWFLVALTSLAAIILAITLLVLLRKNHKLHRYKYSERRSRLASNAGSICSEAGSRYKRSTSQWADRCSDTIGSSKPGPNVSLDLSGEFPRYTKKPEDVAKRAQKSNIGAWDASYRRSMSVDHIDFMGKSGGNVDRSALMSIVSTDSFDPAEYANLADAPNGRGPPRSHTLPAADPERSEGAVYKNIDVNSVPSKESAFFANKPGLVQHPFFAGGRLGSGGARDTVRMSGIVPATTPERKHDKTGGSRQGSSGGPGEPYLIMQGGRM